MRNRVEFNFTRGVAARARSLANPGTVSNHQSPAAVLLRTTLTQTITQNELSIVLYVDKIAFLGRM